MTISLDTEKALEKLQREESPEEIKDTRDMLLDPS